MKKIAVVTGTSRGIGKSLVQALLKNSYKVYGLSRTKTDIDDPSFVGITCNLIDNMSIKNALDKIEEQRIDLLINNAGIAAMQDSLDFSEELFESTFALNFKAPIIIVQNLLNKLEGAVVVNISSVSDRVADNISAMYSASKAALNIYFDSIACKYKNFRIYNLLPSFVDTKLLRDNLQDPKLAGVFELDWDKILKPNDIAELVLLLLNKNEIPSCTKIIAVTDVLLSDLEPQENLMVYNADHKTLEKLK